MIKIKNRRLPASGWIKWIWKRKFSISGSWCLEGTTGERMTDNPTVCLNLGYLEWGDRQVSTYNCVARHTVSINIILLPFRQLVGKVFATFGGKEDGAMTRRPAGFTWEFGIRVLTCACAFKIWIVDLESIKVWSKGLVFDRRGSKVLIVKNSVLLNERGRKEISSKHQHFSKTSTKHQ